MCKLHTLFLASTYLKCTLFNWYVMVNIHNTAVLWMDAHIMYVDIIQLHNCRAMPPRIFWENTSLSLR